MPLDPYEHGKSLGLSDDEIFSVTRRPAGTDIDPWEHGRSLGLSDEDIASVVKPKVREFGAPVGGRKVFTDEELRSASLPEEALAFGQVGVESLTSGLAGLPGAIYKGVKQLGEEALTDGPETDTPFKSAGGRVLGKVGEGFEDARQKLWGARIGEDGLRKATGGSFWGNEGAVFDTPEKAEIGTILGDFAGNVAGVFTGTTEAKLLGLLTKTPLKAVYAGIKEGGNLAKLSDTLLEGIVDLAKAPMEDVKGVVAGAESAWTRVVEEKKAPWIGGNPVDVKVPEEVRDLVKKAVTIESSKIDDGIYYVGDEITAMNREAGGTDSQFFQQLDQLSKVANQDENSALSKWLVENPGNGIAASLVDERGILGEQGYHALYRSIRENNEVIGNVNLHNYEAQRSFWLNKNEVPPEDMERYGHLFTKAINEAFVSGFLAVAKDTPELFPSVRLFKMDDGTLRITGKADQVGWLMDHAKEAMFRQEGGNWKWIDSKASDNAMGTRQVPDATRNKYLVIAADKGIGGVPIEYYTGTNNNPVFSRGRGMDELGSHVAMRADQAKNLQQKAKDPSLYERRVYGVGKEGERTPVDAFWTRLIADSTKKSGDSHGIILGAGAVEELEKKAGSHNLFQDFSLSRVKGDKSSFTQKADKLLIDNLNKLAARSNGRIESVEQLKDMINNPPRFNPETVMKPAAEAMTRVKALAKQEGLSDVEALIATVTETLESAGKPVIGAGDSLPSTQIMGAFQGPEKKFVPIAQETIDALQRGGNSPTAIRFNRENALAKMADAFNGVTDVTNSALLLPITQVFRKMGGVAKEFIRDIEEVRGVANQLQNRSTHTLGKVLGQVGTSDANQAAFVALINGVVSPVAAKQAGISQPILDAASAYRKLEDEFTSATLKVQNRDADFLKERAKYLGDWRALFDKTKLKVTGNVADDIAAVQSHIKGITKDGGPEVYTTLNRFFADVASDEAMQMKFGFGLDHTDSILKMYTEALRRMGKYDENGIMIEGSAAYNARSIRYFEQAADAVLNIFAVSEQKKFMRFMKGVRNVQTTNKLTFAGFRNATQLGITAIISGQTLETLNAVGKFIFLPSTRKAMQDFALDSGALTDSIMHDLILGSNAFGNKTASAMLKVTGFNASEMFNRVVSSYIGIGVARKMASDFMSVSGSTNAFGKTKANLLAGRLQDMGIDPQKVLDNGGFMSEDDAMKGARWMVNNSQYATTPEGLPAWYVQQERGEYGEVFRAFAQFKQFSYRNLTNIYEKLIVHHIDAAKQAGYSGPQAWGLAATSMVPEWFNAAPGVAAGAAATFAANMVIGLANGTVEFPQDTMMGRLTGSDRDTYLDPMKAPDDEKMAINLIAGLMSMDVFTRALQQADPKKADYPWVAQALLDWGMPVSGRTLVNAGNAVFNKDRGLSWFARQEVPAARRATEAFHQKFGYQGEGIMEPFARGGEPPPPTPGNQWAAPPVFGGPSAAQGPDMAPQFPPPPAPVPWQEIQQQQDTLYR